MAPNEKVAVVDKNNQVKGWAYRAQIRAQGLPHRATYILVFNSSKELFVQKRTMTKDVYPGYYDVATGGVVLFGESYEESAARELEEELGIREVALSPHFDFYYGDGSNRVWGRLFTCTYDGDMTLQEEEVESGSFMDLATIRERTERDSFTPDSLYALQRYLDRQR